MPYTREDLKGRVNGGIKGKIGVLVNVNDTLNQAVRQVLAEVDLRSTRRKGLIVPGLFNDVIEYAAPADLKQKRICSIHPSGSASTRDKYSRYELVPFEEFGVTKKLGTIAISDHDAIRKILIAGPQNGSSLILSTLDLLTSGGGTWGAFGTAANVEIDDQDMILGEGSVRFDISAAVGTQSGIVNSSLTPFDYTEYAEEGDSLFVYARIEDPTNLLSYTLRVGSSPADYHEVTVTTSHEGNAFVDGSNLLRFDMENATVTGTPVLTAGTYLALFLNKTTTKISEPDYEFDHIVFRHGTMQNIFYFSKYGWRSVLSAWKENSDAGDDKLNADTDEFEMIVAKATELAALEVDEGAMMQASAARFEAMKNNYKMNNPSDAMLETSDYQAQYYV